MAPDPAFSTAIAIAPKLELIPYEPVMHRPALELQLQQQALTDWLPFSHPLEPSEIDTMLGTLTEPMQAGTHFWMIAKEDDPAAGFIGAMGMQATGYRHLAQVFYWIIPQYQRHGMATEALRIITDAALHEWGYARVQALVTPDNIPSIKALEKADFEREGLLKCYYMNSLSDSSQLADVYMYAITQPDRINRHSRECDNPEE